MENADPLAKTITERFGKLKMKRQGFDTLAQEIAKYVIPRRLPGLNGTSATNPTSADDALLFDTTAVQGNMTLGSGQLAWMCPQESPWHEFKEQGKAGDDAKRWLANATTVSRDELAVSKFYTAVHESFLDRGGFGTCCLYVEEGKPGKPILNVQHWPFGTYVIDEDDEGDVDTVIREFKLTPRQAVQKFGEANVGKKVVEMLNDPSKSLEERTYLHAIYPRADAERDKAKIDGPNKPIASVYIDVECSHVCRTGGYDEMPVMVSRFLEWGSAMKGIYGWSPAFGALPDARQVNHLQKMGDAHAEKAAFPPMLVPDEMESDLDSNAYGVTYASAELMRSGAVPRQLADIGRHEALVDRIEMRQKAIDRAFFVDLFQMFATLDKQMTAREVAERSSEKLIQFSPTFARLTAELFNPFLERVLGILVRSGKLGQIPEELQGQPYRIQYSSRIALALRALPSIGYHRTLERVSMLAPMVPDVLDIYNFDQAERDTALGDGVPPNFLRKEGEVKALRDDRAKAAQAAQQAEAAAMTAEAVAKVGGVKSDTPVGKAIASQLPAAA